MAAKTSFSDENIKKKLFYLSRYHPYRLHDGSINPRFDQASRRILDLKDEADAKHAKAVQFFIDDMKRRVVSNLPNDRPIYGCVVPSHKADSLSPGLVDVMRGISATSNINYTSNPLKRVNTIPKLTSGGSRSIDIHLSSIDYIPGIIAPGALVVLLDDVRTTGNSMNACGRILIRNDAELVIRIALATTVHDY